MKILYVAQVRFPTEKAHGIQIGKVCEALSRAGHDVELLVPRRKNAIASDAYSYYSIERNFQITPLASVFFSGKAGFFIEMITFLLAARKKIAREPKAAVYTRDLLLPLVCSKAVVEVHDLPQGMKFLYRSAWRSAKAFVAKTSMLKRDLVEVYGVPAEKITVIPNGIDLKDFALSISKEEARRATGLPADSKIVLYSGSFQSWKGVDTFLEAASRNEGVLFVLVGGSPAEIDAKRKLYPQKNIIFLGQRPHKDIPMFLAAADALALPNKKGESVSDNYTSPLKLFEYMASGVPILASRLPSITEIVSDKEVFLFEPNDATSFSRELQKAIEHADEARSRSRAAREKAGSFTWERCSSKIVHLLE